jgi:hypothetical protein
MNLRDLTLHEFMVPDITRIYATWHYTNLRDLTLHEFTRPAITQIYGTWLEIKFIPVCPSVCMSVRLSMPHLVSLICRKTPVNLSWKQGHLCSMDTFFHFFPCHWLYYFLWLMVITSCVIITVILSKKGKYYFMLISISKIYFPSIMMRSPSEKTLYGHH